jgi:hypothetical protein
MKPTNIIVYAIAFFLPLVWFLELTGNSNERHPAQPFILCIVLFAGAGIIASKGFVFKARAKWFIASVLVGIVEALGLTLFV